MADREPIMVRDQDLLVLSSKWIESEEYALKRERMLEKSIQKLRNAKTHAHHFEAKFWEAFEILYGIDPVEAEAVWDQEAHVVSFGEEENDEWTEDEDEDEEDEL